MEAERNKSREDDHVSFASSLGGSSGGTFMDGKISTPKVKTVRIILHKRVIQINIGVPS